MNQLDHFDIKVTRKRAEHSKDINGSDRIFIIVDKKLFYTERFWGFKSEKRKAKKWNLNLSEEEYSAILFFISKNQFDGDHQEIIKIDKRFLFNDFTFIIELKTTKGSTVYKIQTNDRSTDNKSWIKAKNLFDFLQNLSDK
ncbi:MAG: hypothetical protein KAI79_20700 [Bacteroidales bacterium]|nr:hypothetical protein [Bacteroidales bacterium]